MKRLTSLMTWDIKLQVKYGFYYAAILMALIWIVVLGLLPLHAIPKFIPLFLFMDILFTSFYFIAGLIYLEKVQGVLDAIVLTPARLWEYLSSKVVTIAIQAIFFSVLIVLFSYNRNVNYFMLVVAVALFSVISSLVGVALAAKYASFSRFMIPSIFPQLLMGFPLLHYFGIYEHWFFYLIPTQPCILLMKAALAPIPMWEMVYSFVYLGIWIIITAVWAYRNLKKFVML